MWQQYDTGFDIPSTAPDLGIEDLSESEWDQPKSKSKKAVKSSNTDDDDDEEEIPDVVMDSADEEDGEDSEEEKVKVEKKKGKGKGKAKKVIPANSRFAVSQDKKQYSLTKIASRGGVGRVMFAFEKVSSSKLLSREGSEEEEI